MTGERARGRLVHRSHWDREGYLPVSRFTLLLVELIDRILDILDTESDYVSFMLDGQAVVLEDYLELRPENARRIEGHIRSGRIVIGPCYVLPEEVLASGEAHIRNFIEGRKVHTSRFQARGDQDG